MRKLLFKLLIPILLAVLVINCLAAISQPIVAQKAPRGPWVDEVVFIEEGDPDKILEMLKNNEIQIYFDEITDPEKYQRMLDLSLIHI